MTLQKRFEAAPAGGGRYIRWFSELGSNDVPLVGGKNASLGEMYRELAVEGVRVPNGFAITAEAYRYALDAAKAWPGLREALDGLDAGNVDDLARRARIAREIVYATPLPDDLVAEIRRAYARLQAEYGERVQRSRCAVRPPRKTCPTRALPVSTRPF